MAGAGALLLLLLMPSAFPPRVHAQHQKYMHGAAWKAFLARGNSGSAGWFARWYAIFSVLCIYSKYLYVRSKRQRKYIIL